ncbi:MAG: hypothetical protein C4576_07945 [Desulfobacteraceae bacterium]|nr:MAG: hypothetical protein C4576_07945 [Desulfobacteraceae bacterium]
MRQEKQSPGKKESRQYQAPLGLVAIFYFLVIAWTFISVPLLVSKAARSEITDALQLIMIVGILCFTWYFSLGIFYRMTMEPDGSILLEGVKRNLTVHPRNISVVEAPFLPIGFIRFKSGRERFYLLCSMRDEDLLAILKRVGQANPSIRFKNR